MMTTYPKQDEDYMDMEM